jgi:hypothetical protein
MGAVLTAVIILAIAIIAVTVVLAILFYHQMLLVNEVNKRLLLITQESIERERVTKEEQTDALIQLAIATENNDTPTSSKSEVITEDELEANFYSDTNY